MLRPQKTGDTRARLPKLPHVDFAIHFSLMDLTRNVDMELDSEWDRIDQLCLVGGLGCAY
ncbi:hypothetical protein R8510_05130 [Ralstonia chuxiongensis]|nr:hypothetical protein R8510_05130 [Ralstonia chuxiongensis]